MYMETRVATLATQFASRLAAMRQELHRHPELSGQETQTTATLRRWLTDAGISVLPLNLTTGLVAEIHGRGTGPVVALRADIDALPVREETGLAYASETAGQMHACGHDFHMAALLGAALVLKEMAGEFSGTVRLLFQPAEETSAGALSLIEAGAMEGVSAVFGMHNKPDLPAGTVGIKAGPLMAAVDTIEITVTGKGGHAAIPDATIDPVVAGSAIVMGLQTAVSRNISPLDSAVVSISAFQAGATHNVIPPDARLLGTVRTFDPATRARLPGLLERIITQIAAGYGATASLSVFAGTPAVINDAAMADRMRRSAESLGLTVVDALPTMGGEDFAEYQALAPGCFIWMGTGTNVLWHHPRFTVDDAVLPQAAGLLAQVALDSLAGR